MGHTATGFDPARAGIDELVTRHAEKVQHISARIVRSTIYLLLFLVPLLITSPDAMFGYADVPRIAAVRVLAAVVVIGWIAHAAAGVIATGSKPEIPEVFGRSRRISVSAASLLLVALVSSIFAVSPATAFRGAYPGFDATELYSLSCYVVIAAAAARFLRGRQQFEAAAWAIAMAGAVASLYGLIQLLDLDPLRFDRYEVNAGRPPLTFGNPSFAGSFLTLSLFVTVGVYLVRARATSPLALIAAAVVALQLFALGISASRGAWVGAAAGLTVLVPLMFLALRADAVRARTLKLHVPLLLGVSALAVLAVTFASADSGDSRTSERLQSFNSELAGSGLNGRQATWTSTLDMISRRPWLEGEGSPVLLRHLFGYGPDNFRYVFQLVAPDEHVASFVPHAHNSVLNFAAELGIAGLLAWIALNLSVTWYGLKVVRSRVAPAWSRFAAAALTAAFVAHGVDQMANIPKASDTLVMWVIVGLIAGLAATTRLNGHSDESNSALDQTQRKMLVKGRPGIVIAVTVIAVAATTSVLTITLPGNARHVIADRAAATLEADMQRGLRVSEISATADRASSLASDASYYSALEAAALETGANAAAADPSLRRRLLDRSLQARERAAAAIPLSSGEAVLHARALLFTGRPAESIAVYERAAELSPNYWAIWLELAYAYASVGRVDDGRASLELAEAQIARQTVMTREDAAPRIASVRLALDIE